MCFYLNFNLGELFFFLSQVIATLFAASINFLLNNYLNFHKSKINTFNNILKSMFKYYMISIPGILLSIGGAGFAYIVLQKTHLFHCLLVFSLMN